MADKPISFGVSSYVKKTVKKIADEGRVVQVVGRIKNGRIELDPISVAALERRFPNANLSFVAVNAPFSDGCRQ